MSDPQKYVNAYIDNAMGMIHENVSTILQLKAQLKIATELVPEKDALIASLQEQLEQCRNTASGLTKSVEEAVNIKASYEAIKNKVSHMDALTSQLNDIKHALMTKNSEFDTLNTAYETLKSEHSQLTGLLDEKEAEIVNLSRLIPAPKKSINKKKVTEVVAAPIVPPIEEVILEEEPKLVEAQPKEENDDF